MSSTSAETRLRPGSDRPSFGPARPASDRSVGPLPLVFGVTGHRDLREEDREAIEAVVREIFAEFARSYEATPLVLISPLAEGADRLVARVALDAGARLVVPLPRAREDYERDFADAASREEFRALLGRATRSFEIDWPPDDRDANGPPRDRSYERVGAYVARNCQLLIALWDGVDTGRPGGTSETVRYRLEGTPAGFDPGHSPLDQPETGPVYQVITPRAGQAEPCARPTRVERFPKVPSGEAAARAAFGRVCSLVNEFNRDVRDEASSRPEDREQSKGYMIPQDKAAGLPAGVGALLDRYATADTLAQHFQRQTRRNLIAILAVGFIVTLLLQLHIRLRYVSPLDDPTHWYAREVLEIDTKDPKNQVWLAWYDVVYLAGAVTLFELFRRARSSNSQRKHLDYRALAEGLRVQFYWRLAGLADSVADHYLRKQRGELDWIRDAIRSGDILDGATTPPGGPGGDVAQLRVVLRSWVDDQILYFVGVPGPKGEARKRPSPSEAILTLLAGPDPSEGVSGKAQARHEDWKARSFRALGNALLYGVLPAFVFVRAFAPPQHAVVIALAVMTTALVLLGIHAKIMAFSEHAKQYSRMGVIFSNAKRHLDALLASEPVDVGRIRGLLKELGEEALGENGDWVLLHRERPLELPRT